ncbi:DUF294 nucleotidyltransferase-like domain-containing protein [Bacillaceae bacterium S4-13-58]
MINHLQLQKEHEVLQSHLVQEAYRKTVQTWGEPPCSFSFFFVGSTGREEQHYRSDQDHGLIFEDPGENNQNYFLCLGKEINLALSKGGYSNCEGNVMASLEGWNRSFMDWSNLINICRERKTFDDLRTFLMLFDAKLQLGDGKLIQAIKQKQIKLAKDTDFVWWLAENTRKVPVSLNAFGKIVGETVDLKEAVYYPIIHTIRLFAIMEGILESNSLERLKKIHTLSQDEKNRMELLLKTYFSLRLNWTSEKQDYKNIHQLDVSLLSEEDKKELKRLIKESHSFHNKWTRRIQKWAKNREIG